MHISQASFPISARAPKPAEALGPPAGEFTKSEVALGASTVGYTTVAGAS